MRPWRARLFAGGATLLGLVGTLAHCADPTQIVLEIYSDACPGSGRPQTINQTGIAVGTANDIDDRRPSAYRDGCEDAPGIGTLTVYPSGDNDADVAIKVVSGVERSPDLCNPPDYAGCIVHRRMMRFIPHATQHAIIRLTLACLNRTCPAGTTCTEGACVSDRDVLDDGGTVQDAPRTEAGAVVDASDGAVAPCVGCKGKCDGKKCVVDCGLASANCVGELCAPTLPCEIKCDVSGRCPDILCTTTDSCTITCTNVVDACGKVTCNARDCAVKCTGKQVCDGAGGVNLVATNNASLECTGDNACTSASCRAYHCDLDCGPVGGAKNACPSPAPCSGSPINCDNWNVPNTGP